MCFPPAGKKISSRNCVTAVKQDLPDNSVIRRNVARQADDQRQGNESEGTDCYLAVYTVDLKDIVRVRVAFTRRSLSCLK